MKTALKIALIEIAYFLALITFVVVGTSMLGGGKLLGELIAFLQYKGPSSPLVISIAFVTVGISVIAFKFKRKPLSEFNLEDGIVMIIGMVIAAIIGWVLGVIVVLLTLQFYVVIIRFLGDIAKGYQSFSR